MAPNDDGDSCRPLIRFFLRHPIQCAAAMIVLLLNCMVWLLWIYIPEGRNQAHDVASFRGYEGRRQDIAYADSNPRSSDDPRVESLTRQLQMLQARLGVVEGRANSMSQFQPAPRDDSSALLQSQLSALSAQVAVLTGMVARGPASQDETTTTIGDQKASAPVSIDKLKRDLDRLAKQNTDRFATVFNRLPTEKPAPPDPARAAQGHVCRSPPCSRDLRSCRAYNNCCVDRMYEMLLDFSEFLTSKKATHFVVSGTLLGAIREQDIIPFTSDLDIVVPAKFWDVAKEINDVVSPRGYHFMVDPQDSHCARVCAVWAGYPLNRDNFIDHFDWDTEQLGSDLGYYMDVYDEEMVPYNMLSHMHYPLSQVRIRDHLFPAPREQELWVEASYGPDWRTPDETMHAGEGSYPSDAEAAAYSKGVLLLRRSSRDARLAQKLISRAVVDHKTGQISLGAEETEERPRPVQITKLELQTSQPFSGGKVVSSGKLFLSLPGNKDLGLTAVESVVVVWATESLDGWKLEVKEEGLVIKEVPVIAAGQDPFQVHATIASMEIPLEQGLTIPEKATHLAVWSKNAVGTSSLVSVSLPDAAGLVANAEDRSFALALEFALMGAVLPSPPTGLPECLLNQPLTLTKQPFDEILLKMVAKNAVAMSQAIAELGRYLKPFVDSANLCKTQLHIDADPAGKSEQSEDLETTSLTVWEILDKALAALKSESIGYEPGSDLIINGNNVFAEMDAMVANCVDEHRKLLAYAPDITGGLLGSLVTALAGISSLDASFGGEGMMDWVD